MPPAGSAGPVPAAGAPGGGGSAGGSGGPAPPAGGGGSAGGSGGPVPPARTRLDIRKTYKLFVGGAFPRSESGRSYEVTSRDGRFLANAARASRKDARDAVAAARRAFEGWEGRTAYNRGQVLYRIAEMLEGRRGQFAAEVADAQGLDGIDAQREVDEAVDRWVWYAGWADKVEQVAGASNPVAGPYFNFSVPEPTGVVAVVAPQDSSLLGLVSVLAPVVVTGNTAVVVASERGPLPAITLTEVLATSDLPAGVVNVLTGFTGELAPVLAAHMDVNAIDLAGVDPVEGPALEESAAGNLKRVLSPPATPPDWRADPGTARLLAFLETKTVWHPAGI